MQLTELRLRSRLAIGSWAVPPALLVVCFLSYGLLSPWLGFYWDDWPSVWYYHLLGPQGFTDVFAIDRPFLGYLFILTTSLFGESAFAWQMFGLVTRWLCCLSLWWTLRAVWPQHTKQATWAAFLFAVYPGFQQQYIALTYSHGWITFGLFLLSLGVMLWALRKPAWLWPLLILSWLLSAYVMFTEEYFFGLELLRPLLLWLVISEQVNDLRRRLQRTVLYWLPYIAIMIPFLVWRLLLTETPRGQVQVFDRLGSGPLTALLQLAQTVLQDVFQAAFVAWGEVFNLLRLVEFGLWLSLLYGITALVTGLFTFFALSRLQSVSTDEAVETRQKWAWQAVLVGAAGLFVGGAPFWATYLPIELRFPYDRFTLPMMFGASLLLVGLLELLLRSHTAKVAFLSLLIGLAAGLHFYSGVMYQRDWEAQKAFFWQLTWRAPWIEPGSLLITTDLPFTYFSDNSLTAPLNYVYAPQSASRQMPYMIYDIRSRLGTQLPALESNIPIDHPYRATSFTGNTSQALVFFYAPPRCLKVLDPSTDLLLPLKPDYMSEALPLSDLSLIQAQADKPGRPPANIFGTEPEHDWCYYFEKADLARQMGDWQQVTSLAEQALALQPRLTRENVAELVPFIDGYAHTGNWEKAVELTLTAYGIHPKSAHFLCYNWAIIQNATPPDEQQQAALAQVRQQLQCEDQ